jgi:hypothetical protein
VKRLLPVLAALMAAIPAQGSGPDDEPTVLEPVIVTQPVSPLDEPYQRLRRMMSDPYCDGCPPLLQADRESIYVKVLRPVGWLTGYGLEVPEIGHEDRVDFHLANDWRQYERIPEN